VLGQRLNAFRQKRKPMSNITISLALAYVLLGVSQVTEDLVADPLGKPMWAMRPTFGKMLPVGLTWFTRPFVEAAHSQQVARGIAFAILKVILSFATLTAYTWVCIVAAEYWFDNFAFRILTIAVLLLVGGRFVIPWVSLLIMPLTVIIALPIEWLFPLKKSDEAKNLKWCKNCGHHRPPSKYEDIIGGSWRAGAMPRIAELPCDIADKTLDVWKRYFLTDLNFRALYPKNCPYFNRRDGFKPTGQSKPPTAMDAFIRTIYGANPPQTLNGQSPQPMRTYFLSAHHCRRLSVSPRSFSKDQSHTQRTILPFRQRWRFQTPQIRSGAHRVSDTCEIARSKLG
jgi:hypothetical protein